MKKSEKAVIGAILLVIPLLLAVLLLNNVFLWAPLYANNASIGKEANAEIKRLVLNKVRGGGLVKVIDSGFMQTVEVKGSDLYTVRVGEDFPDYLVYEFTIAKEDGRYQVLDVGLSP